MMIMCFLIIIVIIVILILKRKSLKNIIQNFKTNSREEHEKNFLLFIILFFPIVLIILDASNIFSKLFPWYFKLTRKYDLLSFSGSYISMIASSILLIFINEKERNENTNVLRQSQRPYLDISYMIIEERFFEINKNNENVTDFLFGTSAERSQKKENYLTLCIKNAGASVAIVDPNRLEVTLMYEIDGKKTTHQLKANFFVNRITIKSGEAMYIKFLKKELYKGKRIKSTSKIIYSEVYYKDLFDNNYVDKCQLDDNLKVLQDNKKIS